MLATLASLVIVGAGVAALFAVATTWRGQIGAIHKVLADARAMEQGDALDADQAFLAKLIESPATVQTTAVLPAFRTARRITVRTTCTPAVPVKPGSRRAAA